MIQGGIRYLSCPLIPLMRLHVHIGGSDLTHGIINLDNFIEKPYLISSPNMGFSTCCLKSMVISHLIWSICQDLHRQSKNTLMFFIKFSLVSHFPIPKSMPGWVNFPLITPTPHSRLLLDKEEIVSKGMSLVIMTFKVQVHICSSSQTKSKAFWSWLLLSTGHIQFWASQTSCWSLQKVVSISQVINI